ncbi:MOSC domain-containing protein [Inquilinus sp. Marseille-Q2685]|uniref:MOSC domain-containing protein n=1 Tax=Inquilinus sp. Marseille-Q2685 TaxID=2866581 RepID=UPI001CE467CE|nr:MOSC domain-containing protein [Inquilinus sp. Marseille-Q2685]
MDGRVAALWRYPVSSLGGERLEACSVDATGLAGDRAWGLADRGSGETAFPETKRRWRPAPQIQARSAKDGLRLDFPDGSSLPAEAAGDALAAHFGFAVMLRPHGADAAEGATSGPLKPRYERHPIHLVTTASLDALREILPDSAIDERRFRPNLVLDLPGAEGFAETGWIGRAVLVGDVRLRIVEPCVRCAFTTIAQGDLPLDPAVLMAVTKRNATHFGVLCTVETPGEIRVGDAARVLD